MIWSGIEKNIRFVTIGMKHTMISSMKIKVPDLHMFTTCHIDVYEWICYEIPPGLIDEILRYLQMEFYRCISSR
jgi:hypothetical protein